MGHSKRQDPLGWTKARAQESSTEETRYTPVEVLSQTVMISIMNEIGDRRSRTILWNIHSTDK